MSDLRLRWEHWLTIPYPTAEYPPGSIQGEIDGVDLALLDGDGAAIVSLYLDGIGPVADPDYRRLVLESLQRVVTMLTLGARSYFEPLLDMIEEIDALDATR